MSTLRRIDTTEFSGSAADAGAAPMLQWISIAQLRVDDAYQRPIGRNGIRTIHAICRDFRWSKFSPVIVAPVAGDEFAIIDGQHRVTAAAACGLDKVPCQVVLLDRAGQAEAFSGINGRTTPVHSMALHRAAVAARDGEAMKIDAVAKKAGIRILPYPVQVLKQAPGETMAVSAVKRVIALCGVDNAVLVLRAIARAGGDKPGMLIAPIMVGCALVFSRLHARGHHAVDITDRLASTRLLREFGRAEMEAREARRPIHDVLSDRLVKVITSPA